MANLKLNLDTMPKALKIALALLPAVLISAIVIVLLILPKNKEIKRLKAEITKQEDEIAKDRIKAARLSILKVEYENRKKRLDELKLQLPEEKEVSKLLKQVSDQGIKSGLKILSWKPEARRDHPSGTIYEIPVAVDVSGSYHHLGVFFSSLTKLDRIVNISDIRMGGPSAQRNEAILRISFKATTFSAVPEKELEGRAAAPKKRKQSGGGVE